MQAIVIKSTGSWYKLKEENDNIIEARIKGKLRLKNVKTTNPIAVGDWVKYEYENSGDSNNAVITEVIKRNNYIIRKSNNLSKQSQIIASNIDLALLVVTLTSPRTSLGFIDRFLVMAGAYHIPVNLIFNKSDTFTKNEFDEFDYLKSIYEALGYPCIMVSTKNEEELKKKLHPIILSKTVLLSGHSGVGKSSILNLLSDNAIQKTDDLSSVHLKGKHTTTFAEMFFIDNKTAIIDTPGIRDFGVIDLENSEISHYFPEMRRYLNKCKFNNCTHINEPDCAVFKAFENQDIAASRYYNYLSIIENKDIFA